MILSFSRAWALVILKTVSTIKELTDVTANVYVDYKLSSYVLIYEFINVEDKLIQNDKLAACFYCIVEFFSRVVWSSKLNKILVIRSKEISVS